jgi:hypothetical protein
LAEARRRPALALYLAALALLPFKWLSPFSYEQAGLTDIFTAAATLAWLIERARTRRWPRVRSIHLAYAAFALCVALAAAFAGNRRLGAENLLITCELIALAVLTSAFWVEERGRRAISIVVIVTVVVTAALALLALLLFYLGQDTSLTQSASGYFKASDLYTRVAAGFESAPLMGSYCIFASAVIAMDVLRLRRRVRWALQGTLALLALITLSRALIGFVVAVALRTRRSSADRRVRLAATVALAASLALTVFLTVAPLTLDPVRPESSRSDINPRLATLKTSAETFWHHPLAGTGPGTLTATWRDGRWRAHSTPVNVAATSGLPALLALIAVGVILWRGRRQETSLTVWSGLAGLGVDALTQDAEHFRHVWIMLGIADAERRARDG